MDAKRQFNCGVHLKVGYRRVIEACEHCVLPMPSLYGFEGDVNVRSLPRGRACRFSWRYAHTTSEVSMFRQLLNSLTWDQIERYLREDVVYYPDFIQATVGYQHIRLLLPSLFYDMYYLRERVYEWELGPEWRRVPHDVPYYMLSTKSI
ncbi:hypothetical protein JCGZ_19747 [Jatropha curcas]|uniref:Uncharacterized protein n=1 Tax=Jatropha curcas TaxID=180498 RepID=A0A067LIY3_JATCU|nr:hypothetical protein JCGZ_19747 [Jatropha curcas]